METNKSQIFTADLYALDKSDRPVPVMVITGTLSLLPDLTGWLVLPESEYNYFTTKMQLRVHIIDNYREYLTAHVVCNTDYMGYKDDLLSINVNGWVKLFSDMFVGAEDSHENIWKLVHTGEVYEGFGVRQSIFHLKSEVRDGFVQIEKSGALEYLRQVTDGKPTRFILK
ncbi:MULTISPECIES: hypothetical protein [unclassified Pseudomonas]|uniref:hypothetical protein n=1 Tax=unclassified Pseudomonas TaxID=196821 RepID=UPI00244D23AF|nr:MULTISPECIES: hypothetical protein [unclassified Pseudomonas]MDH0302745.1 hypothetical protein [Pseudomonas sp. GD04091]MDH1984442.1 hypothetical protein [Pseudomonas sp. GD03689]